MSELTYKGIPCDEKNEPLIALYALATAEVAGKEQRVVGKLNLDYIANRKKISTFRIANGERKLHIVLSHEHNQFIVSQQDVTARTADATKIEPLIREFVKPYAEQRRMNQRFEFV